jgi:hypothetical protein
MTPNYLHAIEAARDYIDGFIGLYKSKNKNDKNLARAYNNISKVLDILSTISALEKTTNLNWASKKAEVYLALKVTSDCLKNTEEPMLVKLGDEISIINQELTNKIYEMDFSDRLIIEEI